MSTEQTNNKERASRQTHTQGNNKNNEGKQHRNKTQVENMQSVTTWKKGSEQKKKKKERNRILRAYENKYPTHLKMAM
jgi:hypothetical protein